MPKGKTSQGPTVKELRAEAKRLGVRLTSKKTGKYKTKAQLQKGISVRQSLASGFVSAQQRYLDDKIKELESQGIKGYNRQTLYRRMLEVNPDEFEAMRKRYEGKEARKDYKEGIKNIKDRRADWVMRNKILD